MCLVNQLIDKTLGDGDSVNVLHTLFLIENCLNRPVVSILRTVGISLSSARWRFSRFINLFCRLRDGFLVSRCKTTVLLLAGFL